MMMNLEGKRAFDLDLLPQILYVVKTLTMFVAHCDRELKVGGPSYETQSQIGGSMK